MLKKTMRDICVAAIGANIILFGLGTAWETEAMMWLALGSGLLCVLGIKLNDTTKEED